MCSRAAALILIATTLTCGCATQTEERLRERAQVAEAEVTRLEGIVAGKDEDNAMLQRYALELQDEILAWQRGAYTQAQHIERLRSHCEL